MTSGAAAPPQPPSRRRTEVQQAEVPAPLAEGAVSARGSPPLDPSQVAVLMPCHLELPPAGLVAELSGVVGSVLVVDDGVPARASSDEQASGYPRNVALLRLPANAGKGHAIAEGLAALRARRPPPEAVLVVDGDGQHPVATVPSLLAAGRDAELVIGDRLGDLGAMPWERRLSNRLASRLLSLTTGRRVRDSQCGMRLLRRRALDEIRFEGGGYEAETRHLKRCLRAGVAVTWVPMPAIYDGEASSFRPVRDSLRVLGALVR